MKSVIDLRLGDCLDLMRTLPDASIDAVITDPPYIIKSANGVGFAGAREFYRGGDLDGMTDFDLSRYADEIARITDQVVMFHSRDQIIQVAGFCIEKFGNYDLHFWHKVNAIPFTNNTWKSDVEYIALGWRKKKHARVNQSEKSKVFTSGIDTQNLHPTQKPLALMKKYIKVLDVRTVFDPFAGSGTTLIAAFELGRNAIGCEINPRYFEIAQRRIQAAQAQLMMQLEEVNEQLTVAE